MKRAVTNKIATTPQAALSLMAKCAGIASYVTLVLLLTQKNLADQTVREAKANAQRQVSIEEAKASRQSQKANFVTKIIQLHTPGKGSQAQLVERLANIIVEESEKASYDPLFVAAVIRSESMFKLGATSSRGARGLMQLMPATGKYISERENIALDKPHDLHDPVTNIRLGIAYLKYLEKKFNGNRERVLLAYNWGPSNVILSLRGVAKPPAHSIKYAKNILAAHSQWEDEFLELARNVDAASTTSMLG